MSKTIVNGLVVGSPSVTVSVVGEKVMPAVSSSMVLTFTVTGSSAAYSAAPVMPVGVSSSTSYSLSPSSTSSFTPVTVTVCAVFQVVAVKVRFAGAAVPSLWSSSETTTAMVTGAVGWVSSCTSKTATVAVSTR